MNIWVVSTFWLFWIMLLWTLAYKYMCFQIQRVIPRSGIPGSYNSMFNLLRKCQTAFHSGCTLLCSPLRLILMPGCFSRVRLFVTPWTVAHQAPLSTGFSRQEYWSGLPFPSPGDLLDQGIEPRSLMSPALADAFFTTRTTNQFIYFL